MNATVQTPTATLAKAASQTATEIDAKGRTITVSPLDFLQYYRLTKALGANANNASAMELAVIAASVRKIDAVDFAMPTTERDVEFVMQQLGFEGFSAVGRALAKLGGGVASEETNEETAAAEDEVAKN